MNDCPNAAVRDRLPDYVHGALSATERVELERHLTTCEMCSAEVALLRDMRGALSRSPEIDTHRIAAAVIGQGSGRVPFGRVEAESEWGEGMRGAWISRWKVAASVAAVIGAGVAAALAMRGEPGRTPSQIAEHVAPPAAESVLVLRGGDSSSRTDPALPVEPGGVESRVSSRPQFAMGGGIDDIADADLELLLDNLERLDGILEAEPSPVLPAIEGTS